jgi:N6-adenosine-specific RNA methylase IME4
MTAQVIKLVKFEAACKAVSEVRKTDEVKKALQKTTRVKDVKEIHDYSIGMKAYATQAKNRDLVADSTEIIMRAARRLDELIVAQDKAVGLNKGAAGGGKKDGPRGLLKNPRDSRPTLKSQNIDKNLANQARKLGRNMTERQFEAAVTDARDSVTRVVRTVVRLSDIKTAREAYDKRKEVGGNYNDLRQLVKDKREFSVIYADPPWSYETYSGKGKERSADRHYDTMELDEIKCLPVPKLAAKNCALFLWVTWPHLQNSLDLIKIWGFDYKTAAFVWVKTAKGKSGLHTGMGHWTRANTEPCLLATRGSPLRINADVHQVIMAPMLRHSEKPKETRGRIERLVRGPYLELFGRETVKHWVVWGNEVPFQQAAE